MKEFFIKNWYYIVLAAVAVLSFIASFIVSLKRKGGSNLIDSVKASLMEQIPVWAILSESLASGPDKKNNVLSLGIALASKLFGRSLTADENNYFVAFISEQLEKILSAPQKKLIVAKKSNSSKYRAD